MPKRDTDLNEENEEKVRLSLSITKKMRDEWKEKKKERGFSYLWEYIDYLIKNDTGDMMNQNINFDTNELRTLKELNKTLLSQVEILTEQLAKFDYLTQLEALNKKITNHIKSPKLQKLKNQLFDLINKANSPLSISDIQEILSNTDISDSELLIALTELAEANKIKLNFHDQTYQKLEEA